MKVLEYVLCLLVNLATLELMKTLRKFSPLFKWFLNLAIHPIVNKQLQEVLFLLSDFLIAFSQPTNLIEFFPKIKLCLKFTLVLNEHSLANLPLNFSFFLFLQNLHIHVKLFVCLIIFIFDVLLHFSSMTIHELLSLPIINLDTRWYL